MARVFHSCRLTVLIPGLPQLPLHGPGSPSIALLACLENIPTFFLG